MGPVETRNESPLVAVCVCTRARPQMLRRCLESLRAQQFDSAHFRMTIILVDNNPEPTARPVYAALCADQPPGGFVHCAQPGIPAARNAALDAALRAGAQLIAFLDDDEVAPPAWLASLVRALESARADAVQGGVRPLADGADRLAGAAMPAGELRWRACESLATCNVLFTSRLVAPPLALRFDESMQFTGGSDREFFMRAGKRGARLVCVDGADVLEEPHEARRSLRFQAARAFAAGSNYVARMYRNEPFPVAAARIAMRALERSLSGTVKLGLSAALLIILRPARARAQWRKGCTSLCFAAGCITPLAGVRAYPYREIQGA